jgi:hypothetical protein
VKREENSSITWNEIPSGPKLEASKPVWKAQQQLETALAKVPLTEKKGNECGESKNNSMLKFHYGSFNLGNSSWIYAKEMSEERVVKVAEWKYA